MKNIIKKLIFVFISVVIFGISNTALAAAPSVATYSPSATLSSITLNGAFVANGAQTTTWFEYGTNQSAVQAGNGTVTCQILHSSSETSGTLTCILSTPTITAGTVYYFRAVASNFDGIDYGLVSSVATLNLVSLSPNSGTQGQTLDVTLNGNGFANGATSSFGAGITVNSTTFLNQIQLVANITVSPTAALGTRNVTVTSGGQTTGAQTFTVNQAPLDLNSISPTSGTQGQANIDVTLDGTGFASEATVNFGSGITVNSTTFVNSAQLTANITISSSATVGARSVTVTSGGQTSNAQTFTVNTACGTAPTISSMSPSSVVAGSGATNVTVNGNNFLSTSTAQFNGSNRSIVGTPTATQLVLTLNSTDLATAGAYTISVVNGSCGSVSSAFTVTSAGGGGGGGGGGGSYYYASAVTLNASSITNNSAVLNGSINPNGYTTTAWFEFGTSNTLATYSETLHVNQGSANVSSSLAQSLTGLNANTTYYFRAVANNYASTVKGNIFSFTTNGTNASSGTVVTTVQATSQASTSARLNGVFVNQDGVSAQGYFQYGKTASLGSTTTTQSLGTASSVAFSDSITGLTPGTIYYFRALAVKGGITYTGNTLVFQTSGTGTATTNTNTGASTTGATTAVKTQDQILQITTATDNVAIGGDIEYLVTFKNTDAKNNFENAKIIIQLPKEVDFKESNFGKEGKENTVSFEAGTLIPDQVGSMTIKGKINSKAHEKDVLITTAIMSYNAAGSTEKKDEIAYAINHVVLGAGLEANPLFGTNFLPSTLIGWMAMLLLVLGLAVVGKKVYTDYALQRTGARNADHIDELPM